MTIGTNTFLLDAYNANPSSMHAALESFAEMPVEKKIVILGDMLELGEVSLQEHKDILRYLKDQDFDKVILAGEEFKKALDHSSFDFLHFKNADELKTWFQQQEFSDTYFLLKGSRLIGLERLLA